TTCPRWSRASTTSWRARRSRARGYWPRGRPTDAAGRAQPPAAVRRPARVARRARRGRPRALAGVLRGRVGHGRHGPGRGDAVAARPRGHGPPLPGAEEAEPRALPAD